MSRIKDLTGQTFGKLTVVSLLPARTKGGKAQWRCRCACGNWAPCVRGDSLTSGDTTSCGCERKRSAREIGKASRTHGLSNQAGNAHYERWRSIKQRTGNPNAPDYHNYGGRGIKLHHTWAEAGVGFSRFKWYLDTVLGPCPEGYTLDRIDNDGNYCPGNLRWATAKQQKRNQR